MKTIVVFGAGGSVGGSVTKLLGDTGQRVIKVVHTKKDRDKIMRNNPKDECQFADVGNFIEVRHVANRLEQDDVAVNSVIYTVGKYEKGGCLKRKTSSVSDFSPTMIRDEMDVQLTGLLFVFKTMLPRLADGGSMVFVSAVTHKDFSHNVIAYTEQERIIELMRNDSTVKGRGILIHHLGFGPILTHYYDGVWVPQALSLKFATKEIVAALEFSGHVSSTKLP